MNGSSSSLEYREELDDPTESDSPADVRHNRQTNEEACWFRRLKHQN